MKFEPLSLKEQRAKISVIGVGGSGGNAINRMIEEGLTNVDFVAINTDAQDLENNNAQKKIQIGAELTGGLGAGAEPLSGKDAVEESKIAIINCLDGLNMVFITAGMGGGTGTGAAPEIAKISKELNILTVGIVTKPFEFEGTQRMRRAMEGIEEMYKYCDTMLAISNQALMNMNDDLTLIDGFKFADNILYQATSSIADLINKPGLINLDFADVKRIMKYKGDALMGTGIAQGEGRASVAAQEAISSPLLQETKINGAMGLLVNISGPKNMRMHEVNEAVKIVNEEIADNADIIFGYCFNDIKDEMRVTVIATGINKELLSRFNNSTNQNNELKEQQIPFEQKPKFLNKNDNIASNDKNEVNDENIVTFGGDDIETPAFLRMRDNNS